MAKSPTAAKANKSLSAKERAFVRELPKDWNPTQAALRAKYAESTARAKAPGWVAKSRHKSTKPHVWDAVHAKAAKQAENADISVEELLRAEKRIAHFDPRRLFDERGRVLPPHEWPDDVALAISGFEVTELPDGSCKYKIRPVAKGASLERMEKHLGMFKDVHVHEGEVTIRWAGDGGDDGQAG